MNYVSAGYMDAGISARYAAASRGHVDVVSRLIVAGADVTKEGRAVQVDSISICLESASGFSA
jgi:hypothetical protein